MITPFPEQHQMTLSKDFKRLQEERNFIQSRGLKGVGRAFFWKRRWKVDGSICAPICWAVLVENLSEHCRCPFTMSASTPREQGPQGSLLGTAPLFQDPKYLKKTVTCFKLTDSLLSHRSFGHNSQFWLFFRASAMCSAHLIHGCSLSYWLITLLLATTNQEGKKGKADLHYQKFEFSIPKNPLTSVLHSTTSS